MIQWVPVLVVKQKHTFFLFHIPQNIIRKPLDVRHFSKLPLLHIFIIFQITPLFILTVIEQAELFFGNPLIACK